MSPVQAGSLAALLSRTRLLLLDFDGPVCSIFAGYRAPQIAEELRDLIAARGYRVAPALAHEQDPLQVLRVAARLYPDDVTRAVADELRAAELTAVDTATPTPGAFDVLNSAKLTGRILSIFSNNSREAVTTYLNTHDLTQYFDRIVGRYDDMNPALLKPNSHLVDLATAGLGIPPDASALVGDSVTDVEAASAVSIPSIGYANKAGKKRALDTAGAATVIGSMVDLADALREAPLDPAARAE